MTPDTSPSAPVMLHPSPSDPGPVQEAQHDDGDVEFDEEAPAVLNYALAHPHEDNEPAEEGCAQAGQAGSQKTVPKIWTWEKRGQLKLLSMNHSV